MMYERGELQLGQSGLVWHVAPEIGTAPLCGISMLHPAGPGTAVPLKQASAEQIEKLCGRCLRIWGGVPR